MKTLNDLNMKYVEGSEDRNEVIKGGAILKCATHWEREQLMEWLPDYDFDMIESVNDWLKNPAEIAEGGYLKVWLD